MALMKNRYKFLQLKAASMLGSVAPFDIQPEIMDVEVKDGPANYEKIFAIKGITLSGRVATKEVDVRLESPIGSYQSIICGSRAILSREN